MRNLNEGTLRSLLGPDHVLPASPLDAVLGVQPNLVVSPGTETELAEVLRLANEAGLVVIPRGGGTKLDWGNPPARADLILSTARINRVLEHAWADLTITVEAGCTVQTLQETLAQHGQRLALDPLWPEKATIGGVLSTNDSGALRLRFGSLRDLIIGVTIALPDGTLARSGGKVVKNVAGYDLPKLVTGALGTLGVITQAVFRLHPLPRHTRSFSMSTANPEETQKLVLTIQDSQLAHVALQSHFSADSSPSTDILFEGTREGLDAQSAHLRTLCPSAKISVAQGASPEAFSSITPWNARQELWSTSDAVPVAQAFRPEDVSSAIAKVSILPADLASTVELIRRISNSHAVPWKLLMQATGLGWLCLEGGTGSLRDVLTSLRGELEKGGGSLVVLRRPAQLFDFDAWGTPSDSVPLMKAVKHQLDPANTLNPGRFLSGI